MVNDIDIDNNDDVTNFSLDRAEIIDDNGNVVSGQGKILLIGNQIQFDPDSHFESLADGEEQQVTIRYTMSDDEGVQSTATVNITVTGTNDAPVVGSSIFLGNINEDASIQINESQLLVGTSDAEGTQLTIENLHSDEGVLSNNGSGSWIFTPNEHFSGTAYFSFDVSDGVALSPAQASINIAAGTDAPNLTINFYPDSE